MAPAPLEAGSSFRQRKFYIGGTAETRRERWALIPTVAFSVPFSQRDRTGLSEARRDSPPGILTRKARGRRNDALSLAGSPLPTDA